MRAVLIGLFIVCSGTCSAQTASVPTIILDSLIFEVKLGRACNEVIKAQAIEIEKAGAELLQTNKTLQLSESKSKTLESLLTNQKQNNELITQQFNQDRKLLKRKLKKRGGVILGETLAIIGLILLL